MLTLLQRLSGQFPSRLGIAAEPSLEATNRQCRHGRRISLPGQGCQFPLALQILPFFQFYLCQQEPSLRMPLFRRSAVPLPAAAGLDSILLAQLIHGFSAALTGSIPQQTAPIFLSYPPLHCQQAVHVVQVNLQQRRRPVAFQFFDRYFMSLLRRLTVQF